MPRVRYLTFALCAAAAWLPIAAPAEEHNADGLKSNDQNMQIETLWQLSQAGSVAATHSDDIARLMTKDFRGKRLAHWCFYALLKTNRHPDQYLDQFIAAAAWLQNREVAVGEEGEIGGPGPQPEALKLPETLKEPARQAWVECLAIVVPLLKTRENRQGDLVTSLRNMEAPPDAIVPELAKLANDAALNTSIRDRLRAKPRN